MRRFRHACATGNVEELMAVLHADADLVADGAGKAAAATRPLLGADRIAKSPTSCVGSSSTRIEHKSRIASLPGPAGRPTSSFHLRGRPGPRPSG